MRRSLFFATVLSVLSGPVIAQDMAPPPMMAPMGAMSPMAFRQTAMMSDAFEIQSSSLALQRSRNPSVRRFAQRMIRDHGATSAALSGGAPGQMAGAPPAMALDPRHAAMLNQLESAQGRQFDILYGQMQVMAHQEAVGLFTAYAQGGTEPGLRGFAQQVLPNLRHHLGMAQRLVRRG